MFVFATPFENQKQHCFKVRKQFHITKEFNAKYMSEPFNNRNSVSGNDISKNRSFKIFYTETLKVF